MVLISITFLGLEIRLLNGIFRIFQDYGNFVESENI